MDKIKENFAAFDLIFRKLLLHSVRKNSQSIILEKFNSWITNNDFEVDLLHTISNAVLNPDNYFYASNEFGGTSELRIGASGYVLICLVLYCRYLNACRAGITTVGQLNHGLKLNLRRVPVARICLDIDIDNALLNESMASSAMKFVVWNVLHFVEPGSRLLITQNGDVANTKSFHLISETQFDVISFETIRNYIQHQANKCGTMKIDTVNNWSFPNGRFHAPIAICCTPSTKDTTSFNEFVFQKKPVPEILSFDDWMLMMPVNPFSINSTYSILDEVKSCSPQHLHCIMNVNINTGYYIKYLTNVHLFEDIDLDVDVHSKRLHIQRVKYNNLFRTANRIDIPREKNVDGRLVFDSFSINLSSLRLLFSSYRHAIVENAIARQQQIPVETFDESIVATTNYDDLAIPHEFYEILLQTRLHFCDDFDMKEVFRSLPEKTAICSDKQLMFNSFSNADRQEHAQTDKVKEFFLKNFTFSFRSSDIYLLNNCYHFTDFPINIVMVLSSSLWNVFRTRNALMPIILKCLYVHYCQKNSIEMFIDERELQEIMQEASESGFTPNFQVSYFGGKLSSRSIIGAHWDKLTDVNVRIILHILKISLENGHYFATLSLTVASRVWKHDVVSNAIIFLLNLFERSRFLDKNDETVNVDSSDVYVNEAPPQMLYTFSQFLSGLEEKNLTTTLAKSFRFSFLSRVLIDLNCLTSLEILQYFLAFCNFQCLRTEQESEGGRSRNKKAKRPRIESSRFKGIYELIANISSPVVVKYLIDNVVCMYKIGSFTYLYDIDQYVLDRNMSDSVVPLVQDVTDTEPSVYNFWIRREMGIYHSFLGTFDTHSPALFSGVYIETPNFISNTETFNMFNYHLKNRLFNVLAKGVHFCKYLNYQQTALVLCGNIYKPSNVTDVVECDGDSLKFAVSSLQVCRDDLKSTLPYPKQLMNNLYKTSKLKYIYQWFYMILCEISQGITIEIARPSAYIFPFQDPNSEYLAIAEEKKNIDIEENDETCLNYSTIGREMLKESEILKYVTQYLHTQQSSSKVTDQTGPSIPKYLQKLVPTQMSSSSEDAFSPYNVITANFFNADDLWLDTMNMMPSPDLLNNVVDIDETIRNHIISVGGKEFEMFIMLLVSWHIRTLHKNFFTSSLYMQYIKKHRQILYDELQEILAQSVGPFFLSHGQQSLVHYFKKFTKCTRLDVDALNFNIQPPRGYVVPTRNDDYIGEIESVDDDDIHSGVIAFIIQAQFNKETILDLLKMVTKCTRPVNRERIAMMFLNRPRTGKNAFSDTLTQSLFKTSQQNSYRYADLINCEHESNGNKLSVAFNRNLVCSFDEVESLPNVFKTVCNNACLSGRLLYTDTGSSFYINAHPILISNIDPVCKECAVVDRVRVFDRYYQFTSLNPAVVIHRSDGVHHIDIPEVNTVFAVQNLLQTLPKENTTVGEHGMYLLIWQMATLFANTQQEPCSQRFTNQMQKTMSRFIHATDPAKYLIAHKIKQNTSEPITVQAFKASIQSIIAQDRTIPRSTSFNLNSIIHDVLDRLQLLCFTTKGIEYISAKVTP